MCLECNLVHGNVSVGVRPGLPVEGIHLILGKGLVGGSVWSDAFPCGGRDSTGPDEWTPYVPVVSVASSVGCGECSCAVTQVVSRAVVALPSPDNDDDLVTGCDT